MTKEAVPRDGWSGRLCRRLREERGRTREWLGTQTGKSAQMISLYELDKRYPSHAWRDAAALALRVPRAEFGREGSR